MATKQITVNESRTVRICDSCNERPWSLTNCFFCGCDLCRECSVWLTAGIHDGQGYPVCKSCMPDAFRADHACTRMRNALNRRIEKDKLRTQLKMTAEWTRRKDQWKLKQAMKGGE